MVEIEELTLEELEALENETVELINDLAKIGEWAIQKGIFTPQELNEIAGLEGLDELEAAEEILAGFIEALSGDELSELEEALEWGFFKNILRKARNIARRVSRGIGRVAKNVGKVAKKVIRKARSIKISGNTLKKAAIGAAIVGGALALPAIAPAVAGAATGIASKVVGSGLFGKVAGWVGRKMWGMWRSGRSLVKRGWNLLRRRIFNRPSPTPPYMQPEPLQQQDNKGNLWMILALAAAGGLLLLSKRR